MGGPNDAMLTTNDHAELKAQLLAHEGLRLRVYTDTVGKLTIGVGHNLTDKGISRGIADALLEEDIAETCAGLFQALPWTQTLDAPRLRVLIDIGFNAGIEGLLQFHKLLAAIQKGDYVTAAIEVINSQLAPGRAQRLAALVKS
jgi:lysozyme